MAYMLLKGRGEKKDKKKKKKRKKEIQRKIVPIPQWLASKACQFVALFCPLINQNQGSKTTLRPISEPRLHLNGKVHQELGVRKMQKH